MFTRSAWLTTISLCIALTANTARASDPPSAKTAAPAEPSGVRGLYLAGYPMVEPSVLWLDAGRRTLETSVLTGLVGGGTPFDGDHTYDIRLAALLGGGSAGFDGEVSGQFTGGWQWVSGQHALLFRAGMAGSLQGNRAYFLRSVELPRAEIGYGVNESPNSEGWALEVGAHGGPALWTKYRARSMTRATDPSAAGGGLLWLSWQRGDDLVNLVVDGTRIGVTETELTTVDSRLCSMFGGLVLCGHALWIGAPRRGAVVPFRSLIVGVSIGIMPQFSTC